MSLGGEKSKTLRKRISERVAESEIPIIVYLVIFASIAALWIFRSFNEDIALNFLAELFGAAFTLFIVDILLVRSKTKRWEVVREDVNYLIARLVNRVRDGISTRAFDFSPEIDPEVSEDEALSSVLKQRADLLAELEGLNPEEIEERISEELFTEINYEYFDGKAEEVWNVLNMKYSDYLHPNLVSLLIDLNVYLEDLGGHIRQYLKAERFPEEEGYYKSIGLRGAADTLKKILGVLNELNKEGYNEYAKMNK